MTKLSGGFATWYVGSRIRPAPNILTLSINLPVQCCLTSAVFYCLEQMKADISVDTVQFILFLYIQQVHKISLRESLVGGEEYPLECRV